MTLPVLIATALALAYLPLAPRPPGHLRSAVKTLAVALLALAAALSQAPILLVLALGLCALGDLLLSRDGDGSFMSGIAAFAAGHLAYIALFLTHPLSDMSLLAETRQLWIALGFLALGAVTAAVLAPRAGALRIPVLTYLPIILGMGLAALTLPPAGALVWLLPSALAFIASDLVLACEKFVLPPSHKALRVTPFVVWPLYWAAQAGFLAAFV